MMVFCNNCKHKKTSWNSYIGFMDECAHKSNIETKIGYDSYHYSNISSPQIKNHDNNCKDFEPTLCYSIKRFLFKSMKD